jgi:hypothetical protein
MRRLAFFLIILFLTTLFLTACAVRPLTMEEKEQYLEEALAEKGIDSVDEELTAELMAEEKVRYAYVVEEDDVVEVHITFIAGTGSSVVNEMSQMAKQLAEEKYPGRTVRVSGSVDVN